MGPFLRYKMKYRLFAVSNVQLVEIKKINLGGSGYVLTRMHKVEAEMLFSLLSTKLQHYNQLA